MFMVGDKVDYHSVIGGPVTSTGHTILAVERKPNNYGRDVAWISGRAGCVALDALSHILNANRWAAGKGAELWVKT